jgi:hypothetical protein
MTVLQTVLLARRSDPQLARSQARYQEHTLQQRTDLHAKAESINPDAPAAFPSKKDIQLAPVVSIRDFSDFRLVQLSLPSSGRWLVIITSQSTIVPNGENKASSAVLIVLAVRECSESRSPVRL